MGFGAMRLCGPQAWGPCPDPEGARQLLRRAVDRGVELIDTADIYGPAFSESLIAEALAPYPPDLVVATKGGLEKLAPGVVCHRASPAALTAACESSLRRMRVERIPLYQLHAVDPDVPLADSVGALAELQQAGKINRIGLCNVTVAQMALAATHAEISTVQNRFNLIDRTMLDTVRACEASATTFLAWFPLAGGALPSASGDVMRLAADCGVTPAQLALAWLLHLSPVIMPIPGTTSTKHLSDNLEALRLELANEVIQSLTN